MLNKTDLSRIDLNLLVLFDAVLAELHVGRAARRLHVSPSAVSHGLGRLRELMRDPLFLRQPKGVVPTERASALAGPVADILERTRQVLSHAEKFDPRHSARRFVIGAPDAISAVLLPPLLARLRRDAPAIDLGVRNLIGQFGLALEELDKRTLDVALLPFIDVPARFSARTLFPDTDFAVVCRAGHPIGRKLSLEKYCAAPHLVVSANGDPRGIVDIELERRGLTRRVALTVSNFAQALDIVATTDLIAAMPRLFVTRLARSEKVTILDAPIPIPGGAVRMVAPAVASMDSGLAWLLDLIELAARDAAGPRRRS